MALNLHHNRWLWVVLRNKCLVTKDIWDSNLLQDPISYKWVRQVQLRLELQLLSKISMVVIQQTQLHNKMVQMMDLLELIQGDHQ